MCGPETIAGVKTLLGTVSQVAAVASTVNSLSGGGGGGAAPSGPKPAKVAPEHEKFKTPGPMGDAPAFLQMSSQMTPLQQRSAIATGGVSGDGGMYRDPAVVDYYRNLAFSSFVGEGGAPIGEPLPIESQYLEQVLGESTRSPGVGGFLNALARYGDGGDEFLLPTAITGGVPGIRQSPNDGDNRGRNLKGPDDSYETDYNHFGGSRFV